MRDILDRYPVLRAEIEVSPIARAALVRPQHLGDEYALVGCVVALSQALRASQEAHAKLLAEGPAPVVIVTTPREPST